MGKLYLREDLSCRSCISICVCGVYVYAWSVVPLRNLCMYVCMYVSMPGPRWPVWVCIYVCIYVCVCVCVREIWGGNVWCIGWLEICMKHSLQGSIMYVYTCIDVLSASLTRWGCL